MSKLIKEAVQLIKAAGFEVYLAESGKYGFYTYFTGERVISFQQDYGGSLALSGNYYPVKPQDGTLVGTGWRIETDVSVTELTPTNLLAWYFTNPPQWATKGRAVKLATVAIHRARYQASSKYKEVQ